MKTRYRHVIGNPLLDFASYSRLAVPRPTIPGAATGSRTFDGSTQSFSAADNADLSTGDVTFTFMVRCKPTNFSAARCVFCKGTPGSAGGEYSLTVAQTTGVPTFSVRKLDNSAAVTVSGEALVAGEWTHIECFHDATNNFIGIRINRNHVVTVALAGGAYDGANDFQIGAQAAGSYWLGGISDVGLWKRRLTALETAWWRASRKATADIGQGDDGASLGTNLVSHWMMRELEGNALDTFNGNELTANGTPLNATGQGIVTVSADYDIAEDTVGSSDGTLVNFADTEAARSTGIPTALIGRSIATANTAPADIITVSPITIGTTASFAFWIKPPGTAGIHVFAQAFALGCIYFDVDLFVFVDGVGNVVFVSHTPTAGAWHHYCVTRAGATVKFYRDGVQVGTDQTIAGASGSTMNYLIGPTWAIGTSGIGYADSMRLYLATELSGAQVAQLAAGIEATGATPTSRWEFDEGV